ncbi:MAG: biliverdin-producing heme oxygenase [Phycisphaerae bacterium]|nr:biliverdin-producing heme oxygenase [Phycisphaerae bacterium]
MLRLKEHTRQLHAEAESHPIQRAMAQGRLPLESYVSYLECLWPVHRALDAGLAALAETDDRAESILSPEQYQSAYLRDDLRHFGREKTDAPAVPAVVELLSDISAARVDRPIALLGFHYVTLGSTNGGRFIAKPLRRAFGLEKAGVSYFDPWGEDQPRIWGAFKHAMDAARFSADETDTILAAAESMFRGITRISESLRPVDAC